MYNVNNLKNINSGKTLSIQDVKLGGHVCSIYRQSLQLYGSLAGFFNAGIRAGQKCAYVTDEYSIDQVRSGLQKCGVDVNKIQILNSNQVYLIDGKFDPQKTTQNLIQLQKTALDEGYSGLRVSGDATWSLHDTSNLEKLLQYERDINKALQGTKIMAMCQYHEQKFNSQVLKSILQVHRHIQIYKGLYQNKFFDTANQELDYKQMVDEIISEQ